MYEPFKKINDCLNIFIKDKNFDIQGIDMCKIGPNTQFIQNIEIVFMCNFIKIIYKDNYFIAGLLICFFVSEQTDTYILKTQTDTFEWDFKDIQNSENAEELIKILKENKEIYIYCGEEDRIYHQSVLIFQIEEGIPETYYYKEALERWK